MSLKFRNNESVAKQISTLIYGVLQRKKSKIQENRQLLLKCMELNGYIINKQVEQPEEEDFGFEEDYRQNSDEESDEESMPNEETEFIVSVGQREHMTVSRFNRTLKQNEKMSKSEKFAISPEEREYMQLNEQYDTVLNKISSKYTEIPIKEIKEHAFDMYSEISRVYKEENLFKGKMKGDIKLGYTLLALHYALVQFNIDISYEQLVVFFDNNINLSSLAKADKFIKEIFGVKLPVLDYESSLLGMKSLFDKATINKIQAGIEQLRERNIFHDPVLKIEVAAALVKLGGITIKSVSEQTGISIETIRKTVARVP